MHKILSDEKMINFVNSSSTEEAHFNIFLRRYNAIAIKEPVVTNKF